MLCWISIAHPLPLFFCPIFLGIVKELMTYLLNAEGRALPASIIGTASAAPNVLLLLASHIAESSRNKIKVIIVPPALPLMVPPAATSTKRRGRRLLLQLRQQLHPTTHQLQCQLRLPTPSQRMARQPAGRKPPSPSTFVRR